MEKEAIQKRIEEIEGLMQQPDFWEDKDEAQRIIKEFQDLKVEAEGGGKYDNKEAVVTILSGAGGDDAEDFTGMLYRMYQKYIEKKGWESHIVHEHVTDHGGYRNITFEVQKGSGSKDVYGTLQHESGVHRLVRISPFNAKKLRHTSFSMVEVIPKFKKIEEFDIPDEELDIQYARSGGPGGQNANKRETAVRVTHTPTNISSHVDSERSQLQNKEKAIEIVKGKLFLKREEDRKKTEKGLSISATVENEWGSQIRSYVLHPYKMVKDHRTDVEVRDVDSVLEGGELDEFVDAARNIE